MKILPPAREIAAAAAEGATAAALVEAATAFGPVVRGDYWLHPAWDDALYRAVVAARWGLGAGQGNEGDK